MNLCSPAGSATTAIHRPDPFRLNGWVDGDQSLKSPATETDFALECCSMNRTPSAVTTGPRATAPAHDTLTAATAATNAARIGQRITPLSHNSPSAGGRTSSTAFRDPNPSALCSAANGSPIHCSPSTTNWYSYRPGSSGSVTVHAPSAVGCSGVSDGFQPLKSPAA